MGRDRAASRGRAAGPALALLAALLLAAQASRAEVSAAEVDHLVRALGYGAGIHDFKNYLLRGRPEYEARARAAFGETLDRLSDLERDGRAAAAERAALAELRRAVSAMNESLSRITTLREKGWRIEDIDRSTAVDLTAAASALADLHGRHRSHALGAIEFHLGFGRGIHHFKDFVLRGRGEDRDRAHEALGEVDAAIAAALARDDAGELERHRLRIVSRTAAAYRARLGLVARLHAERRPVREVDLAVKVNDGPAIRALLGLRAATGD